MNFPIQNEELTDIQKKRQNQLIQFKKEFEDLKQLRFTLSNN